MLARLFRSRKPFAANRFRPTARRRFRPSLVVLEDRVCPSSFGVTYPHQAGSDDFSALASGILAVASKATPKLTVTDAGGTYDGKAFPASAAATGKGGVPVKGSFTFAYYTSTRAIGHHSASAPMAAGTYTVVAYFKSADAAYTDARSVPVTFSIDLALSAANVDPGHTLTLTGAAFAANASTYVVIKDSAGHATRVRAESVTAAKVAVVVPPFLGIANFHFGACKVQVTVEQDAAGGAVKTIPAGSLQIGAFSSTGLKPGAVTLAALNEFQNVLTKAKQNWLTIQHASHGAVNTAALQTYLTRLQTLFANLQAQVQQLADGSVSKITLGKLSGNAVFLDANALELLDQMFVAYFLGGVVPAGAGTAAMDRRQGPVAASKTTPLAASFEGAMEPGPAESLENLIEQFETINTIGKVGIGVAILGGAVIGGAALPAVLAAGEVGGFLLTWGTVLAPAVVGLSALYSSTPLVDNAATPYTQADLKFFYTQIGKGLVDFAQDEFLDRFGEFLAHKGIGDKTLMTFEKAWFNATTGGLQLLGYPNPKSVPTLALADAPTIFAQRPAGTLSVGNGTLTFTSEEMGPDPGPQSFTVTNTGSAESLLHYTVTPSLFSRVHVTGSTAPLRAGDSQSFSVSVDTAGLKPGTYHDAITVTNQDTDVKQTVGITYTVTPTGNPFAGSYTGSFTGSASAGGVTVGVGGAVAFTVDSKGGITVTVPGSGGGSVAASGDAKFAGAGGGGSSGNGSYSFGGVFVLTPSGGVTVSGSWSDSFRGGSGSGTWTATRN
jgi:hypothetical protein